MQGLQNNLKQVVLNNTAHVIVKAPYADSDKLLSLDKVVACAPYLEDEVLLQTSKKLALITLAGVDTVDQLLGFAGALQAHNNMNHRNVLLCYARIIGLVTFYQETEEFATTICANFS